MVNSNVNHLWCITINGELTIYCLKTFMDRTFRMFPNNLLGNVARQCSQMAASSVPQMPPMPFPQFVVNQDQHLQQMNNHPSVVQQAMNAYYQAPIPDQRPTTIPPMPNQRPINLGNTTACLGGFQQHMINLREESRKTKPDNTNFAYDPKQREFLEFCDYVYPTNHNVGSVSSTVTPEKVFQFLYYASRRGKRTSRSRNDSDVPKFDREVYDLIKNDVDYIDPNPIGESTMKQYHGAILRLYQRQIDNGTNNYTKEQIMSENVKFLMKSVKERKARIEEANCVEKNTFSTNAFEVAKKVPAIEEWMWNRHSDQTMNSMSSLRHRYFMLKTHNAILRGESLFKSDLSDMCGVEHLTGKL